MRGKRSNAENRLFIGGSEESPVSIAFLQRVKSRCGPQHGEVRGPDMRWNEEYLLVYLETNLQQVAAIQAQDRSPIGVQIANGSEALIQTSHRLQRGQNDNVVDLARLAPSL